MITLEYSYDELGGFKNLTSFIFLITADYISNAFIENIDKYLLDFNYVNPFQILMFEGMFGLIFCISYLFIVNPFRNSEQSLKDFYLIFLLFLFFFFSCGRNSYRMLVNKLYSPMTRTLTDSIIDPFLILYYYLNDKKEFNESHFYFIINFILLFIIIIFGLIYNEFIVVFCCNLEYETHSEITTRANSEFKFELSKTGNESDNDSDYYD